MGRGPQFGPGKHRAKQFGEDWRERTEAGSPLTRDPRTMRVIDAGSPLTAEQLRILRSLDDVAYTFRHHHDSVRNALRSISNGLGSTGVPRLRFSARRAKAALKAITDALGDDSGRPNLHAAMRVALNLASKFRSTAQYAVASRYQCSLCGEDLGAACEILQGESGEFAAEDFGDFVPGKEDDRELTGKEMRALRADLDAGAAEHAVCDLALPLLEVFHDPAAYLNGAFARRHPELVVDGRRPVFDVLSDAFDLIGPFALVIEKNAKAFAELAQADRLETMKLLQPAEAVPANIGPARGTKQKHPAAAGRAALLRQWAIFVASPAGNHEENNPLLQKRMFVAQQANLSLNRAIEAGDVDGNAKKVTDEFRKREADRFSAALDVALRDEKIQ